MRAIMLNVERAAALLKRGAGLRVLVVGDVMLDRYLTGSAERLSPEAPVPVVHVRQEREVPGGAGNVAWNVRALGAKAAVGGVIGRDEDGRRLARLLRGRGVETRNLLAVPGLRTTVKLRVIADRQQVVRADWETALAADAPDGERLARRLEAEVRRCDGVIIGDYDKGAVTMALVARLARAARVAGVPCGLDPKPRADRPIAARGVTVVTPNRREAFLGAGLHDPGAAANPLEDQPLRRAVTRLMRTWGADHLLVTLGPHGMLLCERGRPPAHVPTRAREVFDVSGAGDTVIAACTLALAAGASFREAAELANYAAGVVVGKIGTATCSPAELLEQIRRDAVESGRGDA